ncbi:MAG: hypothetical protein RIS09_889 [Actinomycetota bacterium]
MRKSLTDDELLAIVRKLADIADEISMTYARDTSIQVESKSDNTPVTRADREVEQALCEALSTLCPRVEVVGEEFNPNPKGSASYWVIDPIDGTKNFIRRVPVWATLIAYVEQHTVRYGMVSAPMLARRWWGSKDNGSYTSDADGKIRSIRVSNICELKDASFSYSDDADWNRINKSKNLAALKSEVWRVRAFGDFWSHLMVAEGAVDIAAEPELAIWDVAALIAIIEGAGGKITGLGGQSPLESNSAYTSNGYLHPQLLGIFSGESK